MKKRVTKPFQVLSPINRGLVQFINLILLIFCFQLGVFHPHKNDSKLLLEPCYVKFNSERMFDDKPLILIILDEYSSPNEIVKITGNPSYYDFKKCLIDNNWIVKSNFHSNETKTLISMSSLFNFNLSADTNFISYKFMAQDTLMKMFKRSLLIDSLQNKKIRTLSYGLVGFYNSNLFEQFEWEKNKKILKIPIICESPFLQSVFQISFLRIIEMSMFFNIENFKKIVLEQLEKFKAQNRTFAYFHVYLPHSPLVYANEFKERELNTLNYIDYWNFTNRKIIEVFEKNPNLLNYRIIITGDHGYKSDEKMNPNNTFGAFYGFEKGDIEKVETVQDIGSLINHYLN